MKSSMHSETEMTHRRSFIKGVLGASLAAPFLSSTLSSCSVETKERSLFTTIGLRADFDGAKYAHEAGFDFLLMPVRKLLVPSEPEAEFEKMLKILEECPLPVHSCNSFLGDGPQRSVGPDAQHDSALRFAETTFKRAKRAGVKRIVFGSSSSRRIPKGWTKEQADEQFISLLKRMGPIAEAEGIIVAVENLQAKECNYLTLVAEVGEIITEVNHPHVKVLPDLFHASIMNEPPENIGKYAKITDIVEIAEKEGRAVPGVHGQDFRPYFKALKENGFTGPIEIEGKWKPEQLSNSIKVIREQSA